MGAEAVELPQELAKLKVLEVDAQLPAAVVQSGDGALRILKPDDTVVDSDWIVHSVTARRVVLEHSSGDQIWIDVASGAVTRLTEQAPDQPLVQDWTIQPIENPTGIASKLQATAAPEAQAP